jgi:superfamily II DNA/RNA helicase
MTQIIDAMDGARKTARQHSRCNVLLSATLSDDIKGLAMVSLHNQIVVDATGANSAAAELAAIKQKQRAVEAAAGASIENPDAAAAAADGESAAVGTKPIAEVDTTQYKTSANLEQYFAEVPGKLRLVVLVAFLRWKIQKDQTGKAIVFFSSRDSVQFYRQLLGYGDARCAFSAEIYTRGCHLIPRMFA